MMEGYDDDTGARDPIVEECNQNKGSSKGHCPGLDLGSPKEAVDSDNDSLGPDVDRGCEGAQPLPTP